MFKMPPQLESLYLLMLRSRLFELLVAQLWQDGLISGEMHLGTGEEAIIAGVVEQLEDGDAMALDHRATAALLMRGVDPLHLLHEFLGHPEGLCGGRGGHMNIYSQEHLAAASGIIGASGPAGVGFALAAKYLRPGKLAVAFFGEGALNQGMLMESLNLAVVWNLPVIFVCKDDGWSITTDSQEVSAGTILERVRGFGIPAVSVDGGDVIACWNTARQAVQQARAGRGPGFIQASCVHLEGHFLGDPRLRLFRQPLKELPGIAGPLAKAALDLKSGAWRERLAGLNVVLEGLLGFYRQQKYAEREDPLLRTRARLVLDEVYLQAREAEVAEQLMEVLKSALTPVSYPEGQL
jgi:TPP-dependent pyruvate/acetoin dehydrogenase alpha subunit